MGIGFVIAAAVIAGLQYVDNYGPQIITDNYMFYAVLVGIVMGDPMTALVVGASIQLMALAIIVCNAFLNAGLPTFTSDYADWTKALMYMCELTFSVAMTVGAVKGAQNLTSKALGL